MTASEFRYKLESLKRTSLLYCYSNPGPVHLLIKNEWTDRLAGQAETFGDLAHTLDVQAILDWTNGIHKRKAW
jgi:hypothetical protein